MRRRLKAGRSFDLLSSYSWYTPGWLGLLGFVAVFLVGALIGSIAGVVMVKMEQDGTLAPGTFLTYGNVIVYPLMFIPAMIYASAISRARRNRVAACPLDDGRFEPLGGFVTAVVASASMITLQFALDPISSALPEMNESTRTALEALLKGPLWVSVLCACIFAPFFEEWLCRGIILRSLLKKCHPAIAIVISAVFFGLIHGNIWQAIPAFVLGCWMGWVYWRTGSLKLTMLMHCVNNTFSTIMSRIPSLEDYDNISDMIESVPVYAAVVAGCLVATVGFALALAKIKSQPEEDLEIVQE